MNQAMDQASSKLIENNLAPTPNAPLLARRSLSKRSILVIVIALAVALRVGSALFLGNEVQILPGIYDQVSYDLLARRVVAGNGFSFAQDHWPITRAGEPTAHWSYLYTLYLAALYATAGAHPLLARLLQAAIAGFLHCWLAWRIGRRIGGPFVGLLSALLSACYIYFFYYAAALMTETFYIIGILWTLDCAMRLAAAPVTSNGKFLSAWSRQRLWLELGLAIGLTTLLRQVFLLYTPLLFIWLWWNHLRAVRSVHGSWRSKLVPLFSASLLSALVACAMIVPWTIRNYRAFHTFVPLNTNSGYAFFWGNHPIYGTNFVGILPADGPSYQELIPLELRHLNEAELDRALLQAGLKFVTDDPLRYILLSVSRTREYFKFWPSSESSRLSNIARVGSFGVLLPFILYGIAVSLALAWHTREPQQRAAIILLMLFCIFYTGIHLLTWALIRYRLPVDAILLLFAATGIVDLAQRFRQQLSN